MGQIGKKPPCQMLATGQTTQYGGYKDDGYYERGKSKKLVLLTSGRYAGATNITLNAKTDTHTNACVYDRRTGLMWSRFYSATLGPASNGKLPWTTNGNGEGIFAYADAANAALLAGYGDWRVPNLAELFSLMDHEAPSAYPDTTAFVSWEEAQLWSGTSRVDATTYARTIVWSNGSFGSDLKTNTYPVVLVRGG